MINAQGADYSFPSVNRYQAEVYHHRTVMIMLDCKPEAFRSDFKDWLQKNYHVWEMFEHEANAAWDRGRRHYSARTIGEYIRHQTMLAEVENEYGFKINNNLFPDLARLYMMMHPDREGFFERRIGQSAQRTA